MRFSQRTPADLRPNPLTRLVEEARAGGRRLCDLTVSNPTAVGLDYPSAEVDRALGGVGAGAYQPEPRGLGTARRAVADYYAQRGRRVHEDSILLTASTSEAYSFLFKLLCDPGDEVLIPQPSYPLFDHLACVEGVVARSYRLAAGRGWALCSAAVEAVLSPRTRAIVLVSPNNPTGTLLDRGALADLGALARDRQLALICDEVFADYLFADAGTAAASLEDLPGALGFSLGGLSKAAGMPQLKLSWIVASGPAAARGEALERLEVIADTFLSVSAPVQRALPQLLRIGETVRALILTRVRACREVAVRLLGPGGPARLLPAAGGWYAVIELAEDADEEAVCLRLLREHDVLAHPGYFFDIDGSRHVVASLLVPPETLEHGLTCLLTTLG